MTIGTANIVPLKRYVKRNTHTHIFFSRDTHTHTHTHTDTHTRCSHTHRHTHTVSPHTQTHTHGVPTHPCEYKCLVQTVVSCLHQSVSLSLSKHPGALECVYVCVCVCDREDKGVQTVYAELWAHAPPASPAEAARRAPTPTCVPTWSSDLGSGTAALPTLSQVSLHTRTHTHTHTHTHTQMQIQAHAAARNDAMPCKTECACVCMCVCVCAKTQ